MALRLRVLRYSGLDKECSSVIRRWVHAIAQPAPLLSSMNHCSSTSPVLVLPEPEKPDDISSFSFNHGFMELMAVPKKKVSPHKRGIRNGPKALKPVPVIVRCMVCGRVKLPHFFCCGGKPKHNEQNESVS